MPFDWREFLIVAHGLRNDNREGVQRTCLGRTYYYVYNLGLMKARAINFWQEARSTYETLGLVPETLRPDHQAIGRPRAALVFTEDCR